MANHAIHAMDILTLDRRINQLCLPEEASPVNACGNCEYFRYKVYKKPGWCLKHIIPGFGHGDISVYETRCHDDFPCPLYQELQEF